jgi:diadenosine tetraphosphatase ApaH/serine/threonine PP2A family protein phosphatase
MEDAKLIQDILSIHIDMMSQDLDAISRGEQCFKLKKIPEENLVALCKEGTNVFMREPTLLELEPPITIVGDLHGQIFDLYQIFRYFDIPPARKYLFLGDMVDRGQFSIEVVSLLFVLKVLYPNNVYIIRGNHEFENVSLTNGFFTEVVSEYGNSYIFKMFNSVFNYLPIAAKIGKIFCIHAGLSPEFRSLSQIQNLSRPIFTYNTSLLIGIFWSDPSREPQSFCASLRGTGFYFNQQPLQEFLERNELTTIVRGHECVDGVKMIWDKSLVTVFSASNYGKTRNRAGVLLVNENYSMKVSTLGPYRVIKRNDDLKCFSTPDSKKTPQTLSYIFNGEHMVATRNRSSTCYVRAKNPKMNQMQKLYRVNLVTRD